MRSDARVVVIGGGVVGASVLYHLTKAGWKDVLLLERGELTCGSTWHAAGGMHTVNGDPNVAKLQQYTINLYRELEQISGQSCGMHLTGGLLLAGTRERLDWLKMTKARGRYLGMELELVSVDEAERMFPLLNKKHFVGALFDPIEGHVDPYGVTHAYAKAAQIGGAEVARHTRVTDLRQRGDGSWDVITEAGNVHAEHVVNAGGLWAREVGRMVGLELPVLAMEHQYFITEDLPQLKGRPQELVHVIDFEGEIYTRQERGGMLLGTYERAGVPWSPVTTPWDFTQSLLPNDLERIAPSLEVGFEHFPALGEVGIRKVVNGPFTFAPDGNPLVGPIRGLRNFWVACGVMAGFSQGGGVGLALSRWMVDGDPGADVWAMDVARYGDWATLAYTNTKVRENYSRRFRIRFPNEELPAARPLRTTPVYERLAAAHAVFGDYCGLEHALWFAPSAKEASETVTFHRSNAHEHVAAECRAVGEGAGLLEISNYGKFEVTGAQAAAWLSQVMANRVPATGRIALVAHAQRARQAHRRLHAVPRRRRPRVPHLHLRRRGLLPALVRALPAAGGSHRAPLCHGVRGPVGGRTALARAAADADAHRPVQQRFSLPVVPARGCRHGTGPRRAHQLHRRARLRDLGDQRVPARAVRPAERGGRGLRPEALRRPGAECHAHREELRQLGARVPPDLRSLRGRTRALRRSQEGRVCRARGGGGRTGQRRGAASRDLQRHGNGCRCGGG